MSSSNWRPSWFSWLQPSSLTPIIFLRRRSHFRWVKVGFFIFTSRYTLQFFFFFLSIYYYLNLSTGFGFRERERFQLFFLTLKCKIYRNQTRSSVVRFRPVLPLLWSLVDFLISTVELGTIPFLKIANGWVCAAILLDVLALLLKFSSLSTFLWNRCKLFHVIFLVIILACYNNLVYFKPQFNCSICSLVLN